MTRGRMGLMGMGAALAWCASGLVRAEGEKEWRNASRRLVIVHSVDLGVAARAWKAYRESAAGGAWAVQMIAADGGGAESAVTKEELRAGIRERVGPRAVGGARKIEAAVLILGDVPENGAGNGVPTWSGELNDRSLVCKMNGETVRGYVTDEPYQYADDQDDMPDVALGRVPARTEEEAQGVLEKIKRFESGWLRDAERDDEGQPGVDACAAEAWRWRVNYVAGEGRFGGMDLLLEGLFKQMVQQQVPAAYQVQMTYAKGTSTYCPPAGALKATVLGQLRAGAMLFNYIGHGSARELDRLIWKGEAFPILRVQDMGELGGEAGPTAVALLCCCSAGWYDLPGGSRSLAEEMLLRGEGPMAVIAGSRPTHPYANAILEKDATRAILGGKRRTVGEADLAAARGMRDLDGEDRALDLLAQGIADSMRWEHSLSAYRAMHTRLYNLLGDPAMVLRPGVEEIEAAGDAGMEAEWTFSSRTGTVGVKGQVRGMREGTVRITMESRVGERAQASARQPAEGAERTDADMSAMYELANDLVLGEARCEVKSDGTYFADLGPLPNGTSVIRLQACGTDAQGRAMRTTRVIDFK